MVYAIALNNVCKRYRGKWAQPVQALSSVSLQVQEGEAFGFVGPNGAGKSSTIKILMGIMRATSGEAFMFDQPVESHLARKGVGYVPENPYLYDYLTPLEVLTMGVRMHGHKPDDIGKHCMRWLERFGIASVAKKRIRSFSKGMTQRVALAHALAVQPRLLVLDEPLSGLDPIGRREVVDVLQEYRQQGGSIFFSSHILHDVERLADRFGIIHKGVLRTVQTPAELVGGRQEFWINVNGTLPMPDGEQESPTRWRVRVPQEQVAERVAAVTQSGQQLRAVQPVASLEEAFLRYVREGSEAA